MNEATAKIVFIGQPGAGKTTCIASLSDIEPVSTDVECSNELARIKKTTTVALDYGELSLEHGGRLLLYGLPGQTRFRFMFDVVREGLLGIVLLVDGSSPQALDGLSECLGAYAGVMQAYPCVLAINKLEEASLPLRERCLNLLRRHEVMAPVVVIDARLKTDIERVARLLLTIHAWSRPPEKEPTDV